MLMCAMLLSMGCAAAWCQCARACVLSDNLLFCSRAVVVLSAALLLVAIVATVSSFGGRHNSSLDESEEYLRVPRRLANLAADHDDRDGLARALNEGRQAAQRQEAAAKARQQAQSLQQRRRYGRMHSRKPAHKYTKAEVEEQHAKDMTARDEKAMMSSRTMVPWVQWPKRDGASFSDPARKQLLLQVSLVCWCSCM